MIERMICKWDSLITSFLVTNFLFDEATIGIGSTYIVRKSDIYEIKTHNTTYYMDVISDKQINHYEIMRLFKVYRVNIDIKHENKSIHCCNTAVRDSCNIKNNRLFLSYLGTQVYITNFFSSESLQILKNNNPSEIYQLLSRPF